MLKAVGSATKAVKSYKPVGTFVSRGITSKAPEHVPVNTYDQMMEQIAQLSPEKRKRLGIVG